MQLDQKNVTDCDVVTQMSECFQSGKSNGGRSISERFLFAVPSSSDEFGAATRKIIGRYSAVCLAIRHNEVVATLKQDPVLSAR